MILTEEQEKKIETINNMTHEQMCHLWRFAPAGHEYFDKRLPYYEVFEERLFHHFGGFTPKISKEINK